MKDVEIIHNPPQTELDKLGINSWPIWEKEASQFPWTYDAEEVCYLLKGKVTVTTQDGTAYEFGAGDLVTFANGLSCDWHIHEDVKKHYLFR